MGKCSDVISIGVARKSEGTIVLKEIIVVFYSPQGPRMGFRNGSQIYLGNGNCIQSNRIWVDVCIGSDHMMPFCDDLWSEPSLQISEFVESEPCNGYLLLAFSVRQSLTTSR